jgi:hypothetical protein
MKSVSNSPWIALALKLVGVLLLIATVIDYITLLSAAKFQDSAWAVAFTTQIVDRGFIPLIAIALLFLGFWVDSASGSAEQNSSPMLRVTALLLASVLGFFFLAVVPWNVLATRDAADTQVKEIREKAKAAESSLDAQIQQFKGQSPQELDFRLAQAEQLINSNQLKGEQLAQVQQQRDQLKRLKADPKALEAQIDSQLNPKRAEELKKIETQRNTAVDQTQGTALRSALRTGLNSLLLAIGYIFIGWTGLRQILYLRS